MEGDLDKKMDRLVSLAEENNKILKGMRSHQRWATFFKVIYWIVILVIAFSAFYLIQPYVDAVTNAYNSMVESINKVKEVGEGIPKLPDIGSFFNRE